MSKSWLCVWLAAGFVARAIADDASAVKGPFGDEPTVALVGARVMIPYPELKALLERAAMGSAPKEEVPPIEAALLSARFRLDVGKEIAALEARFEVAAFADGWRLVPLVGSEMAPASIEPPGADVVTRDGVLCALVHGPARVSVAARFDLPEARKDPGAPFLKLVTQPATSSTLAVSGLGKEERLRVVGLPHPVGGGSDLPLPSEGAALELALEEDRPPVASRWAANAVVLVERDDAFLRYEARILADAVEGSGMEMVLELPGDSREVGVEGTGILRWEVKPGDGHRDLLKISWAEAAARSREIHLKWRTPPRGDADRWTLECASPQGARSFDAVFVAARPESIALDVEPPTAGLPGAGLPGWIREKLGARDHVAAAAGATLVPRAVKTVEAERATVRSLKCATTLVRDGSTLGEGAFEIEHAGAVRWRVRLPEGGRLLKCAVGGSAVRPVLCEDGGLEFLLPSNTRNVSTVHLSYTGKAEAMDPVGGRASLQLPTTPLFADRIEWQLLLPPAYEVTAVDGNLDVGKGEGEALMLEKRLCRGETPAVDLHYRKKAPRE